MKKIFALILAIAMLKEMKIRILGQNRHRPWREHSRVLPWVSLRWGP